VAGFDGHGWRSDQSQARHGVFGLQWFGLFSGRQGVYELLEMDAELTQALRTPIPRPLCAPRANA
jgi:hypothetical protein